MESKRSIMATLDYLEQAGEQDTEQYHQFIALMRELSKEEKTTSAENQSTSHTPTRQPVPTS